MPQAGYHPGRSWAVHMDEQLPLIAGITRVAEETPTVRTFEFDRKFSFTAGQFVMVWIPGVDEIPMALSSESAITVQRVGEATKALFSLREGDKIGLRGPFGTGFPKKGRTLAVAGGVGAAPLLPLAKEGYVTEFLLGARTGSELLFRGILGECTRLSLATDDGSAGHKGFVVELMNGMDLQEFDQICCCGPERMMSAVLRAADAKGCADGCFLSLHRYMKCGMGVCGSCSIDPGGLRVCREGPVFQGNLLRNSEFGRYARDASGRKKKV